MSARGKKRSPSKRPDTQAFYEKATRRDVCRHIRVKLLFATTAPMDRLVCDALAALPVKKRARYVRELVQFALMQMTQMGSSGPTEPQDALAARASRQGAAAKPMKRQHDRVLAMMAQFDPVD